jgi:glutamate-ammonia-ligase adenylyltransferase
MANLFGASAYLGESLLGHPELASGVLFHHHLPTVASVAAAVEEAAAESPSEEDDDPADAFVGALRRAKATVTLQVGLCDLAGELDDGHDSTARLLTALAEAILRAALRFALHERPRAGGVPLPPENIERGLAIVAMGKLGGFELSYGSDLDLFFVYQETEDDALMERYVRVAQRVLRLIDVPHGEGPGYALDTRLRPSGNQGLLVVSDTAFARYHGFAGDPPRAEDWERQALIKARFVAGDPAVGDRAIAVATRAAYERGAPDPGEMQRIRERMDRELSGDKRSAGRFDLKFGKGGLVDVEFVVQWLQMHAGKDPRVRTTETEVALEALAAVGVLSLADSDALLDRYRLLRRLVERLRVRHGDGRSLLERGALALPGLAASVGFRGEADLFEDLAEPIPDLASVVQTTKPPP